MLRKKMLIRVKKGIYVFGEIYARGPFSREVLANMIYGPSYVSLDYALHYYALIPERVEAVTSVTCGRSRRFSTPVGLFVYHMIPMEAYQIGMDRVELEGGRSFLMATPEKALADKLRDERGTGIRTQRDMRSYLLDHLRIDPEGLGKLDSNRLAVIASRYHSRKIEALAGVVRHLARSSFEGTP
jgi:predicted transcriptional regulator of viral defense system